MDLQPLSAAEMLQVCEWGQGQPPVRRALALLSAACPGRSLNELAALSIGRRDALLFVLRELTFGRRLMVMACCPQCSERLELDLLTEELSMAHGPQNADDLASEADPPLLIISADSWRVAFRLPSSQDLLTMPRSDSGNHRALLARCVVEARQGEEPRDTGNLPEPVVSTIIKAMAEADPLAEIRLALTCPACAHSWKPVFDPLAFFWEEIGNWAAVILQEVDLLASAYGWSEADILALSPWRRRAYLEMVHR